MTMRDFLKPLFVTIGMILVIIGLLTFPLPIPVGAIFLIVGLVVLVSSSYTAVLIVRRFRGDHRKMDAWLRQWEKKSPKFVQKMLRRTDPD